MQYRKDKYGRDISILGYGCMRFTGAGPLIDLDKAEREIREAIEGGVNYFDTAYVYPGSEAALGTVLERLHARDRVYIATKLPHYRVRRKEDIDRIFEEELKRLKTDHIDYYLLHMMNDVKSLDRLRGFGIEEWIRRKKESGAISNIGFSYHGNSDMFMKLLDAYDWDFCQIQYNYLDADTQAGTAGLRYAFEKGVPVIIMEPLRGGRLARLPKEAERLMERHSVKRSPAEWGFRWLWEQQEICCVLSGMNSLEMVRENMRAASEVRIGELTEEDHEMLKAAARVLRQKTKVPCTGCRYCMPCPHGTDIPGIFSAYNDFYGEGWFQGLKAYYMCTALRKDSTGASSCVQCGLCETHCPQNIAIREELKKAAAVLENPLYRIFRAIAMRFVHY